MSKEGQTENTTSQNAETDKQPSMPLNRKQKRYMMKQNGMLKYLSKLSPFHPTKVAIRNQNLEDGRKAHQANTDAVEKARAEYFESKLEKVKGTWSNLGYNQSEIKMLEEAWTITTLKNKETYREDRKEAKRLRKKAMESLINRKNK